MTKKYTIISAAVVAAAAAAILIILFTGPLKKKEEPAPPPAPGVKAGDIVSFGEYKKETVEWLVLDTDGEKALLITRYAIDARAFHDAFKPVTWEQSEIRKWMNSVLFNLLFSDEEKARVLTTAVLSEDNPEYGTPGGEDTQDRLFLLSVSEAKTYFPSDESRMCKVTDHAKKQDVWTDAYGICYWWLRSPGSQENRAAGVSFDGTIPPAGYDVAYDYRPQTARPNGFGVRPAVWIDLTP